MRRTPDASMLVRELHTIDPKDVALERVPYIVPFDPAAAVAGGATVTIDWIVPWRDFVWTGMGFTSGTLGFPAAAGQWSLQLQDIGAQKSFQPAAFNVTALIGGNFGVSDNVAFDLPVPWVFIEKTTVRVQFTNLDPLIANTPSLVLVGFLTNWEREANSGRVRQELEIEALKRDAGQSRGFQ